MKEVCRRTPKHGFPTCASALSLQALTHPATSDSFDLGVKTSRFLLDVEEYLSNQVIYVLERFWNAAAARCTVPNPTSQSLCDSSPGNALGAKFDYTPRIDLPSWTAGVRERNWEQPSSPPIGMAKRARCARFDPPSCGNRTACGLRHTDSPPNRHSPCFLTFLTIGSKWRR
jgi:hypothetical protein